MTIFSKILILFTFSVFTLNAEGYSSLQSLLNEAIQNNPQIKASRAQWQALTKLPSQSGSLPNPIIGGKVKNVGFTEFTLGDDPRSDIQVFFAQEIPFPGKLSLKEKIATEKADAKKWLYDASTRGVIADLKEAYYYWFLVIKSIEITKNNMELLKSFVNVAEARYEVGKGIQQDVIKAQVELSEFLERLEILKKKQGITEAKIKSIINRAQNSDLGKPEPNLGKQKLEISLDEIYIIAIEKAPKLNAKSEMIDSRSHALKLAKKQYYPDFVLNGTYFNRHGGSGDLDDLWELGLGLKVPLYFWRKEKFGVEEAVFNLQEAKEDYNNTKNKIFYKVNENYLTAKTAENLIELYKTGIIPQSRLSLESAISGYQVGKIDFLTLLDNLITLSTFEIEYYRKLVEYKIAVARLVEISGLELTAQLNRKPHQSIKNSKK